MKFNRKITNIYEKLNKLLVGMKKLYQMEVL